MVIDNGLCSVWSRYAIAEVIIDSDRLSARIFSIFLFFDPSKSDLKHNPVLVTKRRTWYGVNTFRFQFSDSRKAFSVLINCSLVYRVIACSLRVLIETQVISVSLYLEAISMNTMAVSSLSSIAPIFCKYVANKATEKLIVRKLRFHRLLRSKIFLTTCL